MRLRLIFCLLGVPASALAAPLEGPTVTTTLQIERERGGACSEILTVEAGARPGLAMTDVCHGWAATSCGDKLLVRGSGVIEDQAKVLFTDENRSIDLVPLVDRAIRDRWPDHEHLHLQFGAPSCDGSALALAFSGSHLKKDASGPAAGLRGVVRIVAPGNVRVSVRAGD